MFSIKIKSLTKAQKAMAYLQKSGIRCKVERSFGDGCGFALIVTDKNAARAEVCALLGNVGVSCDIP